METKTAQAYPLVWSYKFPVRGKGFSAGVTLKGRMLLEVDVEEDGEKLCWVSGVNPGSFCAHGETKDAAIAAFFGLFDSIIADLADVAETFVDFKKELEGSFQTNEEYSVKWLSARKEVRQGHRDLPGLARETSEWKSSIVVEQLQTEVPTHNISKEVRLASKAA